MDVSAASLVMGSTATKRSTVASLTFLLYDHVLTLDTEMELIWSRRWSFGKALFIFNRYFGPFTLTFNVIVFFNDSLTDKFCTSFLWWETISAVVAVLSAEIILQARIYAVYDRSKKILALMAVLCLAETASMLSLDGLGLPHGFAPGSSGLTGCYDDHVPSFYFLVWIPELVFEVILCLLMLYKAWAVYKEDSGSLLLNLLVRDSVLYFFTFFAVLLVNCLIWIRGPQMLAEVAVSWAVAVPCALGSRLLLNMRERYFKEHATLSSSTSQGATELHIVTPSHSTTGVSFATTSVDSTVSMRELAHGTVH